MSNKGPFDMFIRQKAGFTAHFVKECRNVFRDMADRLIEEIYEDHEADTLGSSNYEVTRFFLKKSISNMASCHFFLCLKYIDFIDARSRLVIQLVGMDEDFSYFQYLGQKSVQTFRMINEFLELYRGCQERIDNMVNFDDLTSELYKKYKSDLVKSIVGFKEKNDAFVKNLFGNHLHVSWDDVDQQKDAYKKLKSELLLTLKMTDKALKQTRKEFGGIKSRVEEIGLDIGSSTPPNLSRAIEDLTKLGVEENLRKHMNRHENLVEYFDDMKEDLKDMCNKLYRHEVLVNGLKLEGLVDFWRIPKPKPLRGYELECMGRLITEHRGVVLEFIKLEEKVERTRERIKLLIQQGNC